jgi:hypothetical protein
VAVAVVGAFAVTPVVADAPTAGAVAALGGADSATVVPTLNAGPGLPSYLTGVSCVSASFCVATGYYDNGPTETLALVWNGSVWAVTPTPNPGSGVDNLLNKVSCVSVSFCVAVGEYLDGSRWRTLALVWDGSAWSESPTPDVGGAADRYLNAVSCVSVSFCVAAGASGTTSVSRTLALVLRGPDPTPPPPAPRFTG